MSTDARYILAYDVLSYLEPTPMQRDKDFLEEEYGGYFEFFNNGYSLYWDKPKYLLDRDVLQFLCADQIIERRDCELWEIIK
jgi:hypothetical protein